MAVISEVSEKIYQIKPEGEEFETFPLCTTYLIADENMALVEVGCSVQLQDIIEAVDKLGYDIRKLSYIIPTHVHPDHAGGAGLLARQLPQAKVVAHPRAVKVLADAFILERLMQGFKGSKLTREDFLASAPYFIPATIEGYRQYFKNNTF